MILICIGYVWWPHFRENSVQGLPGSEDTPLPYLRVVSDWNQENSFIQNINLT